MEQINITGGSERQNAWATTIVANWIKRIDDEIEHAQGSYKTELIAGRDNLAAKIHQVPARTIIDMHTAKHSLAFATINQIGKKYGVRAY